MIYVPKDVKQYLIRDEIVDKQFDLKDQTVFTSTNRLFIKKGNTVRDISYAHISSIESQARRKWLTVFIGILLIVINYLSLSYLLIIFPHGPEWRLIHSGYVLLDFLGMIILNFWGIIGFFLLIFGFFRKTQRIKFSVVGMSREQKLSGNKDTLDALFRLVSQRRVQLSNTTSEIKDSTENL